MTEVSAGWTNIEVNGFPKAALCPLFFPELVTDTCARPLPAKPDYPTKQNLLRIPRISPARYRPISSKPPKLRQAARLIAHLATFRRDRAKPIPTRTPRTCTPRTTAMRQKGRMTGDRATSLRDRVKSIAIHTTRSTRNTRISPKTRITDMRQRRPCRWVDGPRQTLEQSMSG